MSRNAYSVLIEGAKAQHAREKLLRQRREAWPAKVRTLVGACQQEAAQQLNYWRAHEERVKLLPEDCRPSKESIADSITFWGDAKAIMKTIEQAFEAHMHDCWTVLGDFMELCQPTSFTESFLPQEWELSVQNMRHEFAEIYPERVRDSDSGSTADGSQ